jgi:hypothetical protein
VAEINKFGSAQPFGTPGSPICAKCEAMLTDVIDGILSPDEQAVFDRHLITCADCSRMYIDAKRGAEWLLRIKTPQPEPSAALLQRILATTGPAASAGTLPIAASTQPNTLLGGPVLVPAAVSPAVYTSGNVLPFRQRVVNAFRLQSVRHTFMQPRLAMTAAMAFFSIALTLNLTGVHITQLKASDLKPSSLRRSFYDTNARVVRSIDNLRVVYELESRVQDLQRHDDSTSTPAPQNAPSPAASPDQSSPSGDQKQDDQKTPDKQKQNAPRPRSGSSRSVTPHQSLQFTASISQNERSGSSPQPALPLEQVSFLSTLNVHKYDQQGGQA